MQPKAQLMWALQIFYLYLKAVAGRKSRKSHQKWSVHFLHTPHCNLNFPVRAVRWFLPRGHCQCWSSHIDKCTHEEATHEHIHSAALLAGKLRMHTPIHSRSHAEPQMHTPTHTMSSPRLPVLPQAFLLYLSILSEPLQVPATPVSN